MKYNKNAKLDQNQVQNRRGRFGGYNAYSRFDDMTRKRSMQGSDRGIGKQNRMDAMSRRLKYKKTGQWLG